MTSPDSRRLRVFISILVVFAITLHVASRLADISQIALAPACVFSPMVAGLSEPVDSFPLPEAVEPITPQ